MDSIGCTVHPVVDANKRAIGRRRERKGATLPSSPQTPLPSMYTQNQARYVSPRDELSSLWDGISIPSLPLERSIDPFT